MSKRTRTATETARPTSPTSPEDWIAARVDVTGPIEEERIKPWSTVLRVPTADGLLYYKEPEPALAHEYRLIEILARRRAELVTEVLYSDESGRMLMRDAGPQLSSLPLDLAHWEQAMPLYAQLQIAAMEDVDELLAARVPDRRSARLPAQYRELVAERAPGLSADEYRQLLELVPGVDEACAELGSSGIPETINNDDMTDGTVHLRDGKYRFLDWGDACVSHPFITLTVTARIVEIRHGLRPNSAEIARVIDAYLEPFTAFAPREQLVRFVPMAQRFGQICRILLWTEHPTWDDDPEEIAWTFRLLLDPDAWRSWASDEDEQPPRQGPVS